MKKYILILLVLFLNTTYSQVIVCYGATKTYSVDTADGVNGTSGSTYSWQVKNSNGTVNNTPIISTTTVSGNNISINWDTTAPGNYTLEVVETNASCAAPAVTLSISIKSNPIVTVSNTAVCLGSNTVILATSSPSNPGTDVFSWTAVPAGYTGVTNTNTISITGATAAMAGNYTVRSIDSSGCVSIPVTAALTVNPLPSATISAATTTEFCAGGNVIFTAPAGLSYIWNKGGTVVPSATGGSYTANQTGNYTVTTTDAKGCSNTTNPAISVTVNPIPTVSVTPSVTQFCDGLSSTLSATPAGGTGTFTYQWMDLSGDITINGTNSNYIATTTSDYRVKVIDSKGCVVTSTAQNIFNRPNPNANITNLSATTFCAGDSVVLQRGSAPTLGITYQWVRDASDISAATNFNYTATLSGNYKVRVVDTNFPTNCTITTPTAKVVTKIDLPTTSSITAH